MDGYRNQPSRVAFDDITLTDTFTDNQYVFDTKGMTKLSLDIDYTMDAGESANLMKFYLEHSPDDGENWYRLVIDSTGAESTLTPRVWEFEGTNKMNVIVDIAYKKMRLSVAEEGVVTTAGTVGVNYTLSGI